MATKSRATKADIAESDARLVADAALFAVHAHATQTRDDTGDSYLVHLAEVAALCASIAPFDPVLVAGAWLHDTLEDTDTTEDALRDRFGDAVTDLVTNVTDPPGLKGEARRQRQVDHTAAADDRVKRLKIADKISNTEEYLGLPTGRFRPKFARRYLDWARKVVDVARGAAPPLETRFDAAARRLEEMLARHA